MGRAARRRKLRQGSGPNGRAPAARIDIPNSYRGVLAAMAFGMTVAVAVVVLGLVFLVREGRLDGSTAAGASTSQEPEQHTPVGIDIGAKHLGSLEVEITAFVTLNESRRALTQAEVVAYTDMVQMPGAHSAGPLTMQEVPGQPGRYMTRTTVPMVGDYDVRVQVRSPVQGEARKGFLIAAGAP